MDIRELVAIHSEVEGGKMDNGKVIPVESISTGGRIILDKRCNVCITIESCERNNWCPNHQCDIHA